MQSGGVLDLIDEARKVVSDILEGLIPTATEADSRGLFGVSFR